MISQKKYWGRWRKNYVNSRGERMMPEVFVKEHNVSQRPLDIKEGRSNEIGSYIRSPHGIASAFQWGYRGMGCQQLAFSILFDAFGDQGFAYKNRQVFVDKVIATFPQGSTWKINHVGDSFRVSDTPTRSDYDIHGNLTKREIVITRIGDRLV
jgi:hypothetical protein